MTEPTAPTPPAQDENQIIAERRAKLAQLRAGGHALSLIHISEPTRPY